MLFLLNVRIRWIRSLLLNSIALELVKENKYLGIYFFKNNSFLNTKKYIADQGTRAAYSLLAKARNMHLSIDLQLELFDKLVKPILLYGCELWAPGNIDIIERDQLKFWKHVWKKLNAALQII